MSKIFSLDELLTFAIEIEKEGFIFYETAANKTKNEEARTVYKLLAGEELKHEALFANLLEAKVDPAMNAKNLPEEYHQYMRAMVESAVFQNDDPKLNPLANDAEVITYAIGKEKDSILFYKEMKSFVLEGHYAVIDQIIHEEQLHILRLLDLREKVN